MKKLKLTIALLLTAAFLVACGDKETVTVCENTQLEDGSVWKIDFTATGDKIDSYVWTVGFSEVDVEDINDEEQVKAKLRSLVNLKNAEDNDFRTVSFDLTDGKYNVIVEYKNLQTADEDQLEALGLDENTIKLENRVNAFKDNEAVTCTAQ